MSYYQAPMLADETDAAHALLRLRSVLIMVEQMADETEPLETPAGIDQQRLDEAAGLALAYANISSIARRRFDALAGEAAGFAAAGLDALIQHKQRVGRDCRAGARQLAADMRQSIAAMTQMLEAPSRR
jgi:hypothetical protein